MSVHNDKEETELETTKRRVGRASKLYNAFLSQDMFGVPVTLTF